MSGLSTRAGWFVWADVARVFVNGRSREVIMQDMQRRIERADGRKEREDAIQVSLARIL